MLLITKKDENDEDKMLSFASATHERGRSPKKMCHEMEYNKFYFDMTQAGSACAREEDLSSGFTTV